MSGGLVSTRAAVLRAAGAPLSIETLEVTAPQAGEVLVRLGASGICGTDYSFSRSEHTRVPIVLGHEGAGVVEAVGEGVSLCSVGDHVVLSLIPQCGACRWCVSGQPYLCAPGTVAQRSGARPDGRSRLRGGDEDVFQLFGIGTFAERVVVPDTAIVTIPRDIPLALAALIGCGVLTGLGAALRSAPVPRGGTVLVMGCGGVGMNVIQGARLAGADRIIAVDPVGQKGVIARKLGATHFTAPEHLHATLAEATAGIGVDVAFDVVGSATTARTCIEAVRRGGKTCFIGAKPNTKIEISLVEDLIRDAKTLCSCHYGSSHVLRDVPQAVSALKTGALDLESVVTQRLRLDDINEAFGMMAAGEGLRTVVEY